MANTNKLRIMMFTTSFPRFFGDGTAPFIKSIAEGMVNRGHSVEVVAPYDPHVDPNYVSKIPVHWFRYTPLRKWHIMGHSRALDKDVRLRPLVYLLTPLFFVTAFIKLLLSTYRQKTQFMYAHWLLPGGVIVGLISILRGIPFILFIHGSDIYLASKNILFRSLARWTFNRATFVCACSPELKDKAIKLGASSRTFVLPYGVDPGQFQVGNNSSDTLNILSVGRMVYKKGFDKLIDAFNLILSEFPDAKLIIGGQGTLYMELTQKVINLGIEKSVTFPGLIPWNNMASFLNFGDIFVLPSIHDSYGNVDGLPNVLLEAMSCGLPVIASDIGGVKTVIQDNINGLIVPEGDVAILAKAILKLLNDDNFRRSLGKTARKFVIMNLSWEKYCKELEYLSLGIVESQKQTPRMGTFYRDQFIDKFISQYDGLILDVGCHDGYFLSRLPTRTKIGVDPEVLLINQKMPFDMLTADGVFLPFKDDVFDLIFALDVIEHVEKDKEFIFSMSKKLKSGGKLILTTPNLNIHMVPFFVTNWISWKWGHTLRIGYSKEDLLDLFPEDMDLKISCWNAPMWRFFYLPLRFLYLIAPKLVFGVLKIIAKVDFSQRDGNKGYWVLEAIKV